MKFGKCRFYADENVEAGLVALLRREGFRVATAADLGFQSRDDEFHLQEAKRRKAVLLTRDVDFVDHGRFPFNNLNDTAIVVIRTSPSAPAQQLALMVASLVDTAYSGNRNLYGMKVEIAGPLMTVHARVGGRVRTDTVDIRDATDAEQVLFEDELE